MTKTLFRRTLTASITCLALTLQTAVAYEIERVEPPTWWQGYEEKELQLLVYGKDVSDLTPSLSYDGVSISRVVRTANPNYLFVYLHIGASAMPGEIGLSFSAGNDTLTHRFLLLAKSEDPDHARGFSSSDAIYLITPDRFANGDAGNDNVSGYADQADRNNPGGRHGGDIAGIRQHLDYIKDMGFTAIWLNPVLENAMESYSYHGYATTDFYKVDPRYGSNDDYRQLVAAARERGLGVIMDMIVNHSGSNHWWIADLPSPDWLNFPDDYVETSHQRTTWQDPYAAETDQQQFADGWFTRTMPDLNQRNPLLADYLVQNALWWIEYLGLAGIRMDTYPYPDKAFMSEWTRRVMREYPNFNIVGEEWSENPAIVSYWQRGKVNHDGYVSYLPSLMDFPVSETLKRVLTAEERDWGSSWEPLYTMLANDFLYADPNALVTFPDNHDMSRLYAQLGEDTDLVRMAVAYVLTMRGTPQIYYGTEILMNSPVERNDGLIRSDFPGGWPGDRVNAFTGAGLTAAQQDMQAFIRRLLNWRKTSAVVHNGQLRHFSPQAGIYAYFRYDDSSKVMVVFNKGHSTESVATDRFREVLDDAGRGIDVITGADINLGESLRVPARSVMVIEISDDR